jgi:hypothetical protein
MTGRRSLVIFALVALAASLTLGAATWRGETATAGITRPDRVERVLVFSVPTLSWQDLEDGDAPNLEAVLDESAIADLSVRGVTRRTSATDAYTTIGAGTRAEGTGSATLAFRVGDVFDGFPAAEEFARRTGVVPEGRQIFNFGLVSLVSTNERLLFGAEVGALADALAEAGVDRAVVANGDHPEGEDVEFQREATVGLMDSRGLVPDGAIEGDLLMEDPIAPYGTRYDTEAVGAAFRELWGDSERHVVLVEASDLVRYEDFRPLATEDQRAKLKNEALAWSDELFGRLMAEVDPESDAVVVVAPYAESSGVDLTVMGVQAPGVDPGLLSSGTTRRPGFAQTVDVAPTILSLVGAEVPDSMEGTPMERAATGGDAQDRRDLLIEADEAAAFRDATVGPATTAFVFAQLGLWVLAVLALARHDRRLRTGVEIATLVVLAFLPATYLAGLFPLHDWGTAAYWAYVVAVSTVLGCGAWAVGRRGLVDPLVLTLGAVVGLLAVDIVTGGRLQFNTVFGYTPTVAGRFAGLGNPAFAMLAAGSILLATLLAFRIGGRRGVRVGVAVLALAVVVDGMPFWGADVGGVLSLVPAAGVTAWLLLEYRLRLRSAVLLMVGAVVAVGAFGFLDLTRAPERRTHLGRLFADIGANGWEAFEIVALRKLGANLSVLTSSIWTLMVPMVFAFVAYLFWRAPWRLRRIQETIPQERAAVAGLITAMVLGFALNDSGIAVPGMMLGVANAALVHLVLRVGSEPEWEGGDDAGADGADRDVKRAGVPADARELTGSSRGGG